MQVIILVVACVIAFLVGLSFRRVINKLSLITQYGFEGVKERRTYPFTETRTAKLATTLFALLSIAIASWSLNFYLTQQAIPQPTPTQPSDPNLIWRELTITIFGVATAGLLGGIVFELFLRKEILGEVSTTLAEIVTTDKQVAKEMFNRQKRNAIIQTMLQINTGNNIYGDALYYDFISRFTDDESNREEFRFSFRDHLTYANIDQQQNPDLASKYYSVVDRISYRTELRPINFLAGCASNESQLYELFADPACVYRWLFKAGDFDALMTSGQGFSVSLTIDGIKCELLNGQGQIGKRGFEFRFQNPFLKPDTPRELTQKIGSLVNFQIEANTLQLRDNRVTSVHLAYPVKGVEILLDYENSDIQDVTSLHFLTAGKYSPKIEIDVEPKWAQRRRKILVTVSDDHWLFPNSGVVFVW